MQRSAKTLIERYGFKDPDRMKPTHDEIQIWVYRNFWEIIKELLPRIKIDNIPAKLVLEHPVIGVNYYNQFIVGFIDLYCDRYLIAVEIKTEIPVVGDLIRQIQFYREYMRGHYWIVVCPDDRASSILKDQGIFLIKYQRQGDLFD